MRPERCWSMPFQPFPTGERNGEHNLALNCSLLRQTALNIRELAARDLRLYAFCLVRGSGWTVTDTLLLGSFHRPSTMLDTA